MDDKLPPSLREGKEITIEVDFMDPNERFFRNAMESGETVIVNGVPCKVVDIKKLNDEFEVLFRMEKK